MAVILSRPTASGRLRAALRADAARTGVRTTRPRVGAIVGVEHEFVVSLDGRAIDFRHVIHRLGIPGRRIDVADPNAYRGPWGGTITADGREAEIATPPVTVGPLVGSRLAAVAADGASLLREALPAEATLEGYSTHISVQVPSGSEERAALHLAERYAPVLTWLLDRPESPGLLVRPRPGRVEVGGDFVEGERLALAAVLAVGAVRAAVRSTSRSAGLVHALRVVRRAAGAPPRLAVTPSPAVARYGWFIGDDELGVALHRHGGTTRLPLAGGGATAFGDHLRHAWTAARAELGDVDRAVVARLDALVAAVPAWPTMTPVVAGRPAADPDSDPSVRAWVAANREVVRPGFVATPILMSWDFVVLRVRGGDREAVVSLPRDVLGGAILALESGRLDLLLGGYLASSEDEGRLLASSDQASSAGLFRGIAKGADLALPERQPDGGGKDRDRDDDRRDQPDNRRVASSNTGAAATAAIAAAAAPTAAAAPSGPAAAPIASAAAPPSPRTVAPAAATAAVATTSRARPIGLIAAAAAVVVLVVVVGALVLGGGGSPGEAQGPGASAAAGALGSATPGASAAVVATPAPSVAPAPSAAPSVAAINTDVDVCALLDMEAVQEVTGAPGRFLADGFFDGRCFWGSVQAGVPAYVDLDVQGSDGLDTPKSINGQPCTVTFTGGVGEEAEGGTCISNTQTEVYLRVVERGAIVEIVVNEPIRPLTPEDLVPVVESIFAQLR